MGFRMTYQNYTTIFDFYHKNAIVLLCYWPYRLTVRTKPSQGLNPGSIPGKVTIKMENEKTIERVSKMSFAGVYPHYITKAERKGRTKKEVDEIIRWLTGYNQKELKTVLDKKTNIETFINEAPELNPVRSLITGMICGVRIEEIKNPIMREVRYLDKLIDELAKGRPMEKILRK